LQPGCAERYFEPARVLMREFFFFQAKDGIRADLVTGVQTCALPIYLGSNKRRNARTSTFVSGKKRLGAGPHHQVTPGSQPVKSRSEERRVGKECRCAWGAEQE